MKKESPRLIEGAIATSSVFMGNATQFSCQGRIGLGICEETISSRMSKSKTGNN
jgi:hypothetical protein